MNRARIANALLAPAVFLLPLAGAPTRLWHPGPWIGLVTSVVILLTQPPITKDDMVTKKSDRFSALGIFAGVIGCQLVAVLDFGYRQALRPPAASLAVVAGAALALAGLALRLWAIRTLGRFFTSTVHVAAGQSVVEQGPYRLVRHPSYTGTLIAAAGVSWALASAVGLILVLGLGVPAYLYRIRVEEAALLQGLGEPYRAYRTRTWRLVPFIF